MANRTKMNSPVSEPTPHRLMLSKGRLNFTHSEKRNLRRHAEAMEILSLAISLLGKPESVIDVGGGQGAWCQAWNELGVVDAICVDHPDALDNGPGHPAEHFIACDLSRDLPAVRRCDWATCFEVAEHLPESRSAALVDYLTNCADVVLFSAAIRDSPGIITSTARQRPTGGGSSPHRASVESTACGEGSSTANWLTGGSRICSSLRRGKISRSIRAFPPNTTTM